MKRKILLIFGLLSCSYLANAQVGKNQSVLLNAAAQPNGSITLKWPAATATDSFKIYKRLKLDQGSWGNPVVTLSGTTTSWNDATMKVGSSAEYAIAKLNAAKQTTAIGYLYAGNKVAAIENFGGIILLIDSSYRLALNNELTTLKNDLSNSGWVVHTLYAGRKEAASAVKARIESKYNSLVQKPRALYIIGHVPVPYSGYFSGGIDKCAFPPDGHVEGSGDHTGAWPADAYYGDFDGIYTDFITCTTGSQARHKNLPGDGKFDQCKIQGTVAMEIGRVDLFNMPLFNNNDTLLTKKYLDKVHEWRTNQLAYIDRGLIDDNFTSLDLSATGWMGISSMVNNDSIFNNRDYFTSQNQGNYLWSYGCGAGSYTSCSGIGSSGNFNPGTFKNIFTMLAGSFFGDWDIANNFLRAPLASGSIASFWGGIPKWYIYPMGLGETIGYATKKTQNTKDLSFNGSQNSVHIALMGDPTLRVRNTPPCSGLTAVSMGSKIKLNWNAVSGNIVGYNVYLKQSETAAWTKINATPITGTSTTIANWLNNPDLIFAVRAVSLETTASGSFYNLGIASTAGLNKTLSQNEIVSQLQISPNPGTGQFQIYGNMLKNEATKISVMDVSGRMVHESLCTIENNTAILNISHLKSGIYFVNIIQNGIKSSGTIQLIP